MVATITIPGMFLTGDHASRPAANAVGKGSLYACSTHTKVYQSDGSTWSDWFAGGSGNTPSTTLVYRATDQNVDGSGTITDISFSNEVFDDDGVWVVGSPTLFTIPAALNGRRAIVSAGVSWTASAGGNYRALYIDMNAGSRVANATQDNAYAGLGMAQFTHTQPITLATGNTFKMQIRANTTGIGAIGGQHSCWMSLRTVD